MRVVVLGCGPSGLLAAHAASLADCDVRVVSKKRKSQLFGCQYLHAPIPIVMEDDPVEVTYRMEGDAADYRQKVYGNQPVTASVDLYATEADEYGGVGHHPAWDLRKAYDRLWRAYEPYIYDIALNAPSAVHELERGWEPDLVLSTIPAPLLCDGGHSFGVENVWARGSKDGEALALPRTLEDNEIICNGERDVSWYRIAKVFGYSTIEYPGARKPPFQGIAAVDKPLKTNCTCPDRMPVPTARLGRYGRWQKGFLTHETFALAMDHLSGGVQEGLF